MMESPIPGGKLEGKVRPPRRGAGITKEEDIRGFGKYLEKLKQHGDLGLNEEATSPTRSCWIGPSSTRVSGGYEQEL